MKVHVGIEVRGQIIQCLRDSFENYNFCYKWEKELLKEGNEQGDKLEGYLLLQVRERENGVLELAVNRGRYR